MSGPWEDYAPTAAPADGPWSDYAAKPAPAASAPLSRVDKLLKGVRDPLDGGAQLLTKLLPESVVSAGNRLNNYIADKTGLVGRIDEGGLGDLIVGGKGASGIDKMVRDNEAKYQARRKAAGESGFDGYRALGGLIPATALGVATGGASAGASLAARAGVGAAQGAAQGALAPATGDGDYWAEKAQQVGTGAALGGILPAAIGGVARLVSPNASKNANLALLRDAGVRPTIGQALGGRASRWEEMATSLPVVGDGIASARRRAMEDFNKAAISRATDKVGAKVDDIGQEGVRQAGDKISAVYDDALNQITGVKLDGQFNRDLLQLRSMAQGLTTDLKNKFNKTVNETIKRKGSTGSILPEDYKAVDSDLGKLAADYKGSSTASEREFGDAVLQLQSLLKEQMLRSNPNVAGRLRDADAAWANLVRVEGAAKAGKNDSGVFTPAQLNAAIQGADKSVRKRAVSRGAALMQDLGNAGQSVLGSRYPDSGTAGRMFFNGGAVGLAALEPTALAGMAAGYGAYLPQAQRALVAAAASRPAAAQPAAEALRNASPVLVPGLVQLLLNGGR